MSDQEQPQEQEQPYYEHHVFFCLNQRKPGERTCCADKGAQAAQEHAKKRIKQQIGRASCRERV